MPQNVKILILTVVLIIAGVIFVIVLNIQDFTLLNQSGEQKEGEIIKEDKLSEEEIKWRNQSVPGGDIDFCNKYKGERKDNCISSVANTNNDSKICEQIKNQDIKDKCKEFIVYNEIIKEGNIKKCSSLIFFKEQCYNDFFWQWDDLDRCASIEGDNKNLCEDIINNKLASANKDTDYCKKIKNENLKLNCIKVIENKPQDSDNDGITDSLELGYGTDPFKEDTDSDGLADLEEMSKFFTDPKNSDTDGDGYSDGDEVKNGYNPKGEGKLE